MQIRDLLTEKRLHQLEEMITEISPETLKNKFHNGEIFKLIEVSEAKNFAEAHIDGAMNLTLEPLVETANQKFKKFQQIVLYTQDGNSSLGTVAARRLQKAGFHNVQVLKGGKQAWRDAQLPLLEQNTTDKKKND